MYDEFELRKFVVPEFVFGLNARCLIGKYARNISAKKALIVTDRGIIGAGWLDDIRNDLDKYNVSTVVFDGVHPNPKDHEVMEGARLFKEKECNMIIALGGGSPIDCAKGIGIVHTNGKDIKAFEGVDNVPVPGPPIICIPTTSGSSADVSQFAIIVNTRKKLKFAIVSKTLVPDIALIDPVLLSTLPPYLIACTGMDALTHAIEAYVSNAQSAMSDIHALEAIRLINSYILKAVQDPSDYTLLTKVMLGSLHAGLAFSNASLGAVHAMSHSLGGFLDLPHGECNAVLLRHIVDFNYDFAVQRYETVCQAMDIDVSKASKERVKKLLIERLYEINGKLGIRMDYKDCKVSKDRISILSTSAMNDCCMVTNPRVPKLEEVEAIYEKIL